MSVLIHVLFNHQIFWNFLGIFLLLISSLVPLRFESRFCMFILLNLLRCEDECSMWAWKECIFSCCWIKKSRNVHYVQLIDGVVELNYVFTGFLPTRSAHLWYLGVEVFNYNSDHLFLLAVLSLFASHILTLYH